MDGFAISRMAINANDAVLSMGYYTRADLPYYYALADAFTLCDNYCCSVIGPTDLNRLYTMTASIDPDRFNKEAVSIYRSIPVGIQLSGA